RDELNYVVVKSWDSANEGMRLLQTDVDGRATFLVHPEDAQAKFSFAINENRQHAPAPAPIVRLKDCIRVLDGFGRSLEVILPKLRDGYIAPDSEIARGLALSNPDAYFLSSNGEVFHNVTVTGGKQRKEGPLSLKRELRDVVKLCGDLEAAIQNEQHKIQTLGRELKELTALLGNLEDERREAEKQALTSGHALKQLETELVRTEQRLNTYRLEFERTRSERSQKESAVAEKRDAAEMLEKKRQALEDEIKSAQEQLAGMKMARDGAAQSASEAAARLAGLEERRRSAAAALERIETLSTEAGRQVQSLESQIRSAAAEKQQRENENIQIAARLEALAAEKAAAEATGVQLQHESEQVRARIAEIARVEGEQLLAEETTYREMRTKLENMGPVNMMALEEFKETEQRHEFLSTQRKDLLDSIDNTTATIKEIDEFSRQKFQEAFERINENFQFTF